MTRLFVCLDEKTGNMTYILADSKGQAKRKYIETNNEPPYFTYEVKDQEQIDSIMKNWSDLIKY